MIPFCVRFDQNICIYYTRYPVVDYIIHKERYLLESTFGLKVSFGFAFGIFCFHVQCSVHLAMLWDARAVLHLSLYFYSGQDPCNLVLGSYQQVVLLKRPGRWRKEGLRCDWAETLTEQYLGVKSPGAEHAGQYSGVTGTRRGRSAALQRFTLTQVCLEQWPWKSVKALIHQCH